MSPIAYPWALAADAVDAGSGAAADPHLAAGVHVRALPSPRAGVPATPLVVSRATLTPNLVPALASRDDITWVDSRGAKRQAPFDVAPDNPVYGHLPSGDCVWIELLLVPPPPPPPRLVPAPAAAAAPPLRFAALANGPDGQGVFAERAAEPYVLAGQRIDVVRVSGAGRVAGVRWMAREMTVDRLKPERWRVWSLPVPQRPRYKPTPNAADEAKQRVLRGAPRRQPLYTAFAAASPAAAPPAAPGDALARVDAVAPQLRAWLDALLSTTTVPTWEVADTHAIAGVANGQVRLAVEPHLIGSAIDPDAAHWLGFGDVDDKFAPPAGTVVFYFVRGLWRYEPSRWTAMQQSQLAPFVRPTLAAALAGFPEIAQLNLAPTIEGAYLDLTALAVATVGQPPAGPAVPTFEAVEDRGWLADPPPPEARRMVRLTAGDFGPRALAALAAQDARGLRPLNPVAGVGRLPPGEPLNGRTPLPLTVSRPQEGGGPPGRARFEDRDAPAGGVEYRLAQCDWFGRWSGWRKTSSGPKLRTYPLPPSVELAYSPPAIPAGPTPTGPLAGTLRLRVPVPRPTELPAGGALLQALEVDLKVDGGPATTTTYQLAAPAPAVLEPHPSPGHDVLAIPLAGPAIPRAGSRSVEVVARWVDVLTHESASSAPAKRRLLDPRPPALPAVDTRLKYSARPDATGHARVELTWPSVAGTRYRVFVSTETTLLAALLASGDGTTANEIAAAAPGAPRAEAFTARKSHFGWDAFEMITPAPIVATGSTTTFIHRLSGSLDVLAVYRVLSESEAGALAEITEADLVPVAVPNLGPPAQPLVAVERAPEDHEHAGVALRVRVPAGRARPVKWRLRRASVPVNDPLRMDVVHAGDVLVTPGPDGTTFTITDATPLKRWRQYRWAVEVQAGPPAGAPTVGPVPAGEWSPASAPVTLAVIPTEPPAPPTAIAAAAISGGVQLTITHPDAATLAGTALGAYRFELFRRSPNARPTRLTVPVERGPGSTYVAIDPTPPPHSTWAVRLVDPLGRASDTALSNEV